MADHSFDDVIAAYYARLQEGLPPPVEPHPGYATLGEAWLAHRLWLRDQRQRGLLPAAPPPVLPD